MPFLTLAKLNISWGPFNHSTCQQMSSSHEVRLIAQKSVFLSIFFFNLNISQPFVGFVYKIKTSILLGLHGVRVVLDLKPFLADRLLPSFVLGPVDNPP